MAKIIVYADGSCIGNPGPGGFAALAMVNGEEHIVKGKRPDTTNNQMELVAVIKALQFLDVHGITGEIHMHLDSQYVLNGATKFLPKRLTNGRKLATGKPVKNQEQRMKIAELIAWKTIYREWVEGHSDNDINNRVDKIARGEAMKLA